MLALVAGVLLLAALLVGSLWVVSIFWESHRSEAIAVVAAAYALAGSGLMWWLSARLRAAPPLLQSTLSELKQDFDALRGASRRSTMTRRSRDDLALRREALATRAALQRIELAATLDQARKRLLARKGIGAMALHLARSLVVSRSGPTGTSHARPWMLSGGWGARTCPARVTDRALGDGGAGRGRRGMVGRAVAAATAYADDESG